MVLIFLAIEYGYSASGASSDVFWIRLNQDISTDFASWIDKHIFFNRVKRNIWYVMFYVRSPETVYIYISIVINIYDVLKVV